MPFWEYFSGCFTTVRLARWAVFRTTGKRSTSTEFGGQRGLLFAGHLPCLFSSAVFCRRRLWSRGPRRRRHHSPARWPVVKWLDVRIPRTEPCSLYLVLRVLPSTVCCFLTQTNVNYMSNWNCCTTYGEMLHKWSFWLAMENSRVRLLSRCCCVTTLGKPFMPLSQSSICICVKRGNVTEGCGIRGDVSTPMSAACFTKMRSRECMSPPSEFLQNSNLNSNLWVMWPFSKNCKGSCPDMTGTSNLKSVALTVLELLAFNAVALRHTRRDIHRTKTVSPPFTPFTWRRKLSNFCGFMPILSESQCNVI